MSYDPKQPEEPKKIFGVIVHSFFVVPFLLAVFCVLLFAAVRILTMEKHSVYDYLDDVKNGGVTKRWQAAFELSRMLGDKKSIPTEERFFDEMAKAYEGSQQGDDLVRQYLAMAMAKTGDQRFADVLLRSTSQEKDENLYANINALGILQNAKATNVLLKYLKHDHARIRLAAVIALGHIADPRALEPLKGMLNDAEPNITWDAAIALAKMGDRSGRGILIKLLDRNYLNNFPNITPQSKSRIIQVAIEATASWQDPEIKNILQELFKNDPNMKVRTMAHQVLEQYK